MNSLYNVRYNYLDAGYRRNDSLNIVTRDVERAFSIVKERLSDKRELRITDIVHRGKVDIIDPDATGISV